LLSAPEYLLPNFAPIYRENILLDTKINITDMKAAVIYQKGDMPQYVEFPEPISQREEEIVISVLCLTRSVI